VNEAEHRALAERLMDILGREEYDRLGEVYAADVVVEFPQSGERFRGIENVRGQFENYPGSAAIETRVADVIGGTAYALTPMYTVVAVEGSGDRGTSIVRTRYPDGSFWWIVSPYELEGGRIARIRSFFAPEFEAPAWREPYWDRS
jgi:ketosteroid isomerase-like protein